MKKRVFIVHGWGGSPQSEFHPWLKKELESRGCDVKALAMPDSENPRMEIWVPFLKSQIKNPDDLTVLVGHSMGCQALMRYLATLPEGAQVGKLVCIAGYTESLTVPDDERPIADAWMNAPLDHEKVKRAAKEIVAFFSDDDPFVPLENEVAMREKLGAKTFIEHDMGHYDDERGIKEVPTILTEIIK